MKTKKDLELLTIELRRLERCGRYEEALRQAREVWEDYRGIPKTDGIEFELGAEILLRCGSIISFHGHDKQLSESQESAKNLLTEARNRFIEIDWIEKVSECENYLALAYWRTGEFTEAETWLEESMSKDLPISSHIRLYSLLIRSMIYEVTGRRQEVIDILGNCDLDFHKHGDAFLVGCFCTNLGIALKNLGRTIEAIDKFEEARHYHKKSGHLNYRGTVENNLAMTYKTEGRFYDAHCAVDNAIGIYKQLGDKARIGSSLDTKAQIYFEETKYDKALSTIEESLEILKRGKNTAFLTEAWFTKSKIQVFLDDVAPAALSLFKAIEIARTQVGEEAAERLAKEFEITVRKKSLPTELESSITNKIYEGDLELVLPPSLSNYDDYQLVRIRNSHLVEIGIPKNSLAVVVEESIKRGDLIALTEIANDSIICGFYDYYAGIVSVSGINSETYLFKTEEVKVVGKIIGVGGREPGPDGKIQIKPIDI